MLGLIFIYNYFSIFFIDVLILLRAFWVSFFVNNIAINLFLIILYILIASKTLLVMNSNTVIMFKGALLSIFSTINIIEAYKDFYKEKAWLKQREFYYLLFFEQIQYLMELLSLSHSVNGCILSQPDKNNRIYFPLGRDFVVKVNKTIHLLSKEKVNNATF